MSHGVHAASAGCRNVRRLALRHDRRLSYIPIPVQTRSRLWCSEYFQFEYHPRITTVRKNVAIVGLGYVGLPLGIQFGRSGHRVLGIDIDPEKLEAIRSGRPYLQYISGAAIAELVSNGHFDATTDFSRVAEARAVIICVPTPLDISAALPSPYRLFDGFRQTAHRTLKALLPTGPSFSTAGHIIGIAR